YLTASETKYSVLWLGNQAQSGIQYDGSVTAPKLPVGDSPPSKDAFPGKLVSYETFDDLKSVGAVTNLFPSNVANVADGLLSLTMKDDNAILLAADLGPRAPDLAFITRVKLPPAGFTINFRRRGTDQ